MISYMQRIYACRYFWFHLALSDLRNRFRRSKLGLLWAVLNPLLLTMMISFVMSALFNRGLNEYALYVFSGLIVWSFILQSGTSGCAAIISAESYMHQFNHPVIIYSLRVVLVNLMLFALSFIGLVFWVIFYHYQYLNWSLLSLIPTLILYLLIGWALATITAFINTKFRDFSQLLGLIFQAIWYMSPVFIAQSILVKIHDGILIYYNPVYYMLNLIRDPFLHGKLPTLQDYYVTAIVTVLLWFYDCYLLFTREREIIFMI
jgi:lipopolysaccharide transport system permease protein